MYGICKGKSTLCVGLNPVSAKIRGVCKTEKQTYKALDFVERNVSDGEEVLAMLIYVSLEKKEALYNLEFAQNFILFMQQMKEGWKNGKLALKAAFLCCDNLYRRVENVQDFNNEGIPLEKSQLEKDGMEHNFSHLQSKANYTHQTMRSKVYFRFWEKRRKQENGR